MFLPYHLCADFEGTGSYTEPPQGWQLNILFKPSHPPLKKPNL
jgi:hypothetical protein